MPEVFQFAAPSKRAEDEPRLVPWKVLSVEDDPDYQASLAFTLSGMTHADRPVHLLTAQSATAAAKLLSEEPDIAVILLDVVMEDDDAGLRLVGSIRDAIGNDTVRIVLLTGQPGMAPRRDVMRRFNIDDYWCKSEISSEQLLNVVTTNLRTWDHLRQLQQARQGLAMVVDACRAISNKRDLKGFAQEVLEQISRLIDFSSGGILCIRHFQNQPLENGEILAATGDFRPLVDQAVSQFCTQFPKLAEMVPAAANKASNYCEDGCAVLHFSTAEIDDLVYSTLVMTNAPLTPGQKNLLHVFSENIGTNFVNVALHNRLSELAYMDIEIGCPNRNHLLRSLESMTEAERRTHKLVVIMVDYLQDIVVAFGDDLPYQLFRTLYAELGRALPGALIARCHEAGFAILVPDQYDVSETFFEQLFSKPLEIADGQHMISVTTSVLHLADFLHLRPLQLLSLAESSVSEARRDGIRFHESNDEIETRIASRYSLLSDLRSALLNRQLSIALQPKVRLDDQRLVGAEALVRWLHPDGHMVRPDEFIGIAETAGLIDALDEQVLEMTCDAVHELDRAGIRIPISFNAASNELTRPGYFARLLETMEKAKVTPSQLDLEITESRAICCFDDVAANLRELIDIGMGVSIDDFGTGFSSLSYITQLSATTLKIDRTFVTNMSTSTRDHYLISIIVKLARQLGFHVVAEGVETEEQRSTLLEIGCDVAQGYLFAKPMPLAD